MRGQPRFAGAPLAAPGPPVCLVPGQPLPSREDEKGASGTWVWHRDGAGRAPLAGCAQFCVTPSPSAGRRCAGPAVPACTAGARPFSEAPLQAAGTPPADVSNGASSERMGGWLTESRGRWRTVSGATAKQDAPNHTVGLSRGAHGPHQAPGTSAHLCTGLPTPWCSSCPRGGHPQAPPLRAASSSPRVSGRRVRVQVACRCLSCSRSWKAVPGLCPPPGLRLQEGVQVLGPEKHGASVFVLPVCTRHRSGMFSHLQKSPPNPNLVALQHSADRRI